jgi:uncharacterized damage-inducible protein DinB
MLFEKETVLRTLEDLPKLIEEYSQNIPEEALDIKRNDETWTIREHIYHMASVQEMLYDRILTVKNEEHPVITPYFPENEKERNNLYASLEEAFTHYKAVRRKQISLIKELAEDILKKEASHGEYISYNIPIILNHMIFHEYWHMYRIEAIWLTRDEFFS